MENWAELSSRTTDSAISTRPASTLTQQNRFIFFLLNKTGFFIHQNWLIFLTKKQVLDFLISVKRFNYLSCNVCNILTFLGDNFNKFCSNLVQKFNFKLKDYPSVGHINHIAKEHSVNIIWAVTQDKFWLYKSLEGIVSGFVMFNFFISNIFCELIYIHLVEMLYSGWCKGMFVFV